MYDPKREPLNLKRYLNEALNQCGFFRLAEQKGLTPLEVQTLLEVIAENPGKPYKIALFYNAFAENRFERSTKIHQIVFGNTFARTKTPKEISGIAAHELAHIALNHGYKRWKRMREVTQKGTDALITITCFILVFLGVFLISAANKSLSISLLSLAGILILVVCSFLLRQLESVVIQHCLRRDEYRADALAAKWGYGSGLLSFLEKCREEERQWRTTNNMLAIMPLSALYSTHPSHTSRIKRLRKLMEKPPA